MNYLIGVILVALSGFISLSFEMLWYRGVSIAFHGEAQSFGLMLSFFLIGIGIGSSAAKKICANVETGDLGFLRWVGWLALAGGVVSFLAIPFYSWVVTTTEAGRALGLFVIAATSAVLGVIFPLISHFVVPPDDKVGRGVSWLYASNIVGSVSGSLITGLVLMDRLQLHEIAGIMSALSCVMALGCFVIARSEVSSKSFYIGVAVSLGLAISIGTTSNITYDRLFERLQHGPDFDGSRAEADVFESKTSVVMVQDGKVWGGGLYDGRVNFDPADSSNGIIRPYSVKLFHPKPRRILFIGMSTGAWSHVVANMEGVEEVVIVEINERYLEIVKGLETRAIFDNPKVKIVIDDARRWLVHHPEETFDVIVGNPTYSFASMATNLLSAEYQQLVKRHLRPNGVYLYNATMSIRAAMTTIDVFEHALRFVNVMVASDSPIDMDVDRWISDLETMKIGDEPVFGDNERDRHVLKRWREIANSMNDPSVPIHLFYRTESAESLKQRGAGLPIITDDNLGDEFTPPQALFTEGQPEDW